MIHQPVHSPVAHYSGTVYRGSTFAAHFHNSYELIRVLSGMTPDGKDGYSRLTELCLTASGELRVIDPKINLRVSKKRVHF